MEANVIYKHCILLWYGNNYQIIVQAQDGRSFMTKKRINLNVSKSEWKMERLLQIFLRQYLLLKYLWS